MKGALTAYLAICPDHVYSGQGLGLGGGSAQVGGDDDALRFKKDTLGYRFLDEDINGGAGKFLFSNGLGQCLFVNQTAAGGVYNPGGGFHGGQLFGADHPLCGSRHGHVEADEVGLS
jgi:hypothetical protein